MNRRDFLGLGSLLTLAWATLRGKELEAPPAPPLVREVPPEAADLLLECPYSFHVAQELYLDAAGHHALVGGRGCGKTFAGSYDLLYRALVGPAGRDYLLMAPTWGLIRHSAWPTLLKHADRCQLVRYRAEGNRHRLHLPNGATIHAISAEQFARGGHFYNVSGAWIDEAQGCDEEVFYSVIALLRQEGDLGWLGLTLTPPPRRKDGREHWIRRACREWVPTVSHARMGDNPHLAPEFAAWLRGRYSLEQADREVDGHWQ